MSRLDRYGADFALFYRRRETRVVPHATHSPKKGENPMKDKVGLIVPILMMLIGAYALISALGSSGDSVALLSDHQIPRGLAMMFGLIGLGGGVAVLLTSLSKGKSLS
jgi:hypothetical protein